MDEEQYTSTSDQSICYIAQDDDVEIHGFGFYRHYYESINEMQLRTKVLVTNAEDDQEHPVFEKTFDTIYTKYEEIEFDEHKICKYNFVETLKWEPIKVNAGFHFHLQQSYYHPSTSEKFYSGKDGEKWAEAQNMDMGVFKVKASHLYTSSTDLHHGQLPGLLYKYCDWNAGDKK